MKVFLDANVLFSAAYSETGASAYIFEVAEDLGLDLVTCHYAVEEAERNLTQKAPSQLERFRKLLRSVEVVVTVLNKDYPAELPEKDAPIYCSSVKVKAQYLVTLDKKDFGFLFTKKKEPFLTCLPLVFLEKLREILK